MGIELNQFRAMAQQHPDAGRIVVDGEQVMRDARPTTVLGTVVKWFTENVLQYMPGSVGRDARAQIEATLSAENADAVTAFRSALASEFGDSLLSRTPALATDQPLTPARVGNYIDQLNIAHAAKMACFDTAIHVPTAENLALAMDYVMEDVRLPPGPHAHLLAADVRSALQPLFVQTYRMDASPHRDLLGQLGSQLAVRLEDYLLRGLEAHIDLSSKALPVAARDAASLTVVPVSQVVAQLDAAGGLAGMSQTVPALRIHLDTEIAGFRQSTITLLARVERDLGAIDGRFFPDKPSTGLTGLVLTNSDPHKGGQRVALLSLNNGEKLVYKPRDVRIDEAITGSDLAGGHRSLLEEAGATAMLYKFMPCEDPPAVLHGPAAPVLHYGYVAFLPHDTARQHLIEGDAAARDYHMMLGRGTAALMMAGATDIHHENIMVSQGTPFFTDLEFAFAEPVLDSASSLLVPSDGQVIGDDMARLMQNVMLDKAMTLATDNNSLHAPCRVTGDSFEIRGEFDEVTESLLVVRTDDGAVIDNRRPPDPDIGTIGARYARDFGEGVRAGLQDLQRPGTYAGFLHRAADFHIRYHPLSTQDQRAILDEHLSRSMHPDRRIPDDVALDSPRRRTPAAVLAGTVENTELERGLDKMRRPGPLGPAPLAPVPLDGAAPVPDPPPALDPAQRSAMRTAMYQAYGAHDVPYFSRTVAGTEVYLDGVQALSWATGGGISSAYFPAQADVPARPLAGQLAAASAERLQAIGNAAAQWMAAQAPQNPEFISDAGYTPKGDTRRMLTELGAPPRGNH